MFRDSRQLDRQRTAASCKSETQKYIASAENWFDGTPNSIDRRLVACERLLHFAQQTVARMPVDAAAPYLRVASYMKADLDSLHNLRDAMITGASDYAEVAPAGYREAAGWYQGEDPDPFRNGLNPNDYSSREEFMNANNMRSYIQDNHQRNPHQDVAVPSLEHDMTSGDVQKEPYNHPYVQGNPYHPVYHQYPSTVSKEPSTRTDITKENPSTFSKGVSPLYQPPPATPKRPPGEELHFPKNLEYGGWPNAHGVYTDPPHRSMASLGSDDRRWVTLESQRFVAANSDALDDSRELAIRAHNHASVATSTYSSEHSAAMCRAFVGAVVEVGRQSYQPPARPRVASVDYDSIPAEAMFL